MKPVEREDLLSLGAYERIRDQFVRRIIETKRARRVALGSNMTALFENRDTVLFQIQEMLRTERISAEPAILHEIETYNALVPTNDELAATIFIEYPEQVERERMLTALAGVEARFFVTVDGVRASALGGNRGDRSDRATAVHYLKFPLTEVCVVALRSGKARVTIGVDHEAYRAETELPVGTLSSLQADFG
jgi:hypothetical protein